LAKRARAPVVLEACGSFRLRIESHSATPSPTLILNTPADFQLIVFPLGVKVRFACSFNP
jgi:hypothetical protein